MRNLKTAFCAVALLCAPCAAQSAVTYYVGDDAFTGAAGTTRLESFEALSTATPNVAATPDVTIACSGSTDCLDYTFGFPTDGAKGLGVNYGGGLTFLFADPVRTFGIDVIGFATAGLPSDLLIQVGSATPVTLYANQFETFFNNVKFAGLISDTPFSQVTIYGTDRGDFVGYDRLRYGAGPAVATAGVPEPASWALMILGLGGAGAMLRRRRAAAFAAT